MDTNSNALRPGTILHGKNDYLIERILGIGGFGITYLASTVFMHDNIPIKGFVAIKEHFMGDYCIRRTDSNCVDVVGTAKVQEMVSRACEDFLAEARRLSRLSGRHNNIVRVNEVFEANDTAYFVMEYLEGSSLQQFIEDVRPLNAADLRAVFTPIIDAVAFLHRNRFTHLDIKPANIMLASAPDGSTRPVLIDFGLSKHYDEDGNATSTVNICGVSNGYSPVEQYCGISTFSPWADVYALGATMLACATGRRPAVSSNWPPGEPSALIDALALDEPLKQAMKVALNPSTVDRFQDAEALLTAIGARGSTFVFKNDIIATRPKSSSTEFLPKKEIHVRKPNSSRNKSRNETRNKIALTIKVAKVIALSVALIGLTAYFFFGSDTDTVHNEEMVMSVAWWETRRTPGNLKLAVNLNGEQYYLSGSDYECLSTPERASLEKLGLIVMSLAEDSASMRYILGLNDLSTERLNWNQAMELYGDCLPTREQGVVWALQADTIKSMVEKFGGMMGRNDRLYWTKTEKKSSYADGVDTYFHTVVYDYKTKTHYVRGVYPLPVSAAQAVTSLSPQQQTEATNRDNSDFDEMPQVWWQARRTPGNLKLAVNHNGERYYLSEIEWMNLSDSHKSKLNKEGLVVIGRDNSGITQRFILALHDITMQRLTWNEANRCYSNRLPNKNQGEVWVKQAEAIKTAVEKFGGRWANENLFYWTNTQIDSRKACTVCMPFGSIGCNYKSNDCLVRAVAELQE